MNLTFILSFFIFGATAFVVFSKKIINSLIAMSVFSMMLVVFYFLLHAPDVAITEAALGAGLSTLVFLVAIKRTKEKSAMLSLEDYFHEKNIITIVSKESEEILRALIETCLKGLPEETKEKAVENVLLKRNAQEINLGEGIALTHERMDQLDGIYTAIGILKEPVRYFKGPPVRMILCILLPNKSSREYLSMMARLSRFLMKNPPDDLAAAFDPEEIRKALADFEESRGR